MTWREFEEYCVEWLKDKGYWVHRMAESNTGSQPFDLMAFKDWFVYAIDCKVISTKRKSFPFSRIELNQYNAMKSLKEKYKGLVECGFFILFEGYIYWLDFEEVLEKTVKKEKSISLDYCNKIHKVEEE